MRSLWARVATFAVVVALVVGTAGVAGYATAPAAPDRVDATVEKGYFTSQEIVENAQLAPRSGDIELTEQPERTVMISTDGSVEAVEPVVRALVRNGHEVRIHGGGGTPMPVSGILGGAAMASASVSSGSGDLATELAEVDALFAVGGSQFSDAEYATIEAFAENGSVVLATDPGTVFQGSASDALTSRFGVAVGDGYLYNMHENDANFQRIYAAGADSDLAAGVDRVVLDTAVPLQADAAGSTALTAAEQTRYDTTRETGTYDVAVQSGNAVVIGDADFMAPLDYNRADNDVFLGNVLDHLVDTPENPYSVPTEEPQRPTAPTEATPGEPTSGTGAGA
jgi:hypothetical protein